MTTKQADKHAERVCKALDRAVDSLTGAMHCESDSTGSDYDWDVEWDSLRTTVIELRDEVIEKWERVTP